MDLRRILMIVYIYLCQNCLKNTCFFDLKILNDFMPLTGAIGMTSGRFGEVKNALPIKG